jgi:hypothetical protein
MCTTLQRNKSNLDHIMAKQENNNNDLNMISRLL